MSTPVAATRITLSDIAARVSGLRIVGRADVAVSGVTLRSGDVRAGDLFAAVPGTRVHGAAFAEAAVAAGAVAVLTDQEGARRLESSGCPVPLAVAGDVRAVVGPVAATLLGEPARDLRLVGVTGTNGKTTTTFLVDAALRRLGRTTGLVGTVEYRAGSRVSPSTMTSPDAPDLHRLLAAARAEGADLVTMECSSHALDQRRLAGLTFDVVAFLNLSREHLDHHVTMEAYYAAKARLFEPPLARRGVVVVDDAWGRRLAREARIPVVTLSCGVDADPATIDHDATWTAAGDLGSDDFLLVGPGTEIPLRAPLPGDHNRIDTAVAAVVLLELGLTPEQVRLGLSRSVAVPGRMQRLDLGPGAPRAYVDFVHTPDGMRKAARSLRRRTQGRLVVTVGAGGDRDPGKRRPMGWEAATSGADVLVVTDDHPRSECPASIRAEILAGVAAAEEDLRRDGLRRPEVIEVHDGRRRALEVALDAAGPEGTVGFFGLGPDRHQHIGPGGARVPFVETDEIRAAWARVALANADSSTFEVSRKRA